MRRSSLLLLWPSLRPPRRANSVTTFSSISGRDFGQYDTRARAFLRRVEPAVAGQRGDLHTFRVCCRIVRGFDLTDDESLSVLEEWNARCEPPWSENELLQKVVNATKYGREEPGGML
jgi:hypothetical protein